MPPILFLICLPESVSKAQIETILCEFGSFSSCTLLKGSTGNIARVEMTTGEAVHLAVERLSGHTFYGRTIYACAGDTEIGEEFELLFLKYFSPKPIA